MVSAQRSGVILIVIFISSVNLINARNITSIKTAVNFESSTKLMESSNNGRHLEVTGRVNSSSQYASNTILITKRKLAELKWNSLHSNDKNIYTKSKYNNVHNKQKNTAYRAGYHSDSYRLKQVRKRETNATATNETTTRYEDGILLDDVTGLNNTNCSNDYCISDEDYLSMIDDYMFPTSYEWLLIVLHSMVFLIGLVGNALVCVAVYRNHSMRTVTNYFIVNLAVADFMVILFCLPPTVLWDVTETWFMGEAMCKVVLYIQTVSVTVSVLTLTFISIDRWYAICFPLKFKSTTGRAKTAILVIWLLALAFDIPELVVLKTFKRLERVDTHYFIQCEASWSKDSDTTWSVVKMILLYAFPLAFMSIAYLQIVRVLWQSDNIPGHMVARPGAVGVSGSHRQNTFTMNSNASTEGQLRSRRKAAKMLVAVVVMFAVCYFPVHLFSVMRLLMQLPQNDTNTALALLSHWMCYANSAVNPVIYNFMSGKFRKEFRSTFGCTCCYKKTSQSRRQRHMTRSSTYVYRFTHGGSTIARTEVLPLSQLHHNHQTSTNNNHGYALHDTDHYMHTVC